ncbi:MAG: pectate lyase [Muribaculaceae bacterium]|nr:pectate lyase [Muribaculaceae bacterium]
MNLLRKLMFAVALAFVCAGVNAAELSSLSWSKVCSGGMDPEWYGSAEAQAVADILIETQKTSGGWMKNLEFHNLPASDYADQKVSRDKQSCLDNAATTQEMRFLAKVWQKTKVEKYRESFLKALNMIFEAEKDCGGWSQYWPLSGKGSYQDYITFNDDLVINVLKLLREINGDKGDFAGIADDAAKTHCQAAFDRGIDMIIKCQIDDNGKKAAWCAQHDPADMLPAVGRPHELPSVSGCESASLLSFLMTIPEPSKELQEAITAAVTWLDEHKIEGKAIEDYINAAGEKDRRVVDKPGSAIWGRFIQLGGEKGKEVYEKFFKMLGERGKSRSHTYQGKTYTYTEEEIARSSYRPEKEYQPIFAIYKDEYAHLFYRFLYNYEDTDPVVDEKGLPIATSLMATNRASYQYLGSWCQNLIKVEYPAWKQKVDAMNEAGDATMHELSDATYISSSEDKSTYMFGDNFSVSNQKGKGYGKGKSNTVKYSAGVEYTIQIPEGKKVVKISFNGYDNYDVDAYLSELAGVKYGETDYVFPAKTDDMKYVTHTIDLSAKPVSESLPFKIGSKQCCLIITLYCVDAQSGIDNIVDESKPKTVKRVENGQIVIIKDGRKYNIAGQDITDFHTR